MKWGFLFCVLWGALCISCERKLPASCAYSGEVLEEGNLVFRKGRNNLSRIVTTLHKGVFSHVGILWKDNGRWSVIHASDEAGCVVSEPLDSFVSSAQATCWGVGHLRFSERQIGLFLSYAKEKLREKTSFDYTFNMAETSRMYCTELVYDASLYARMPLIRETRGQWRYLYPQDFWQNPKVSKRYFYVYDH